MTKQELAALVQLLNRLALTQAEALWLQGLITKLQAQVEALEERNGIEMG
jgi:tRNA C32,U32 (ribose-2'-O)-methylase TrmJ